MDEETGLPPMDPRGRAPYVELAVQHAPSNPASAWLWRPKDEIQGQELSIRIGGSFVWPPSGINLDETKKVLFIAGGVGIKYAHPPSHLRLVANQRPALSSPCSRT
jgi:hypothetical protein